MNWGEAVEAMKFGHKVQRASERWSKPCGDCDGVPIVERGEEPCLLAHAWTHDERPVMVFVGAWSREMFVPDSDHRNATDWVVVL